MGDWVIGWIGYVVNRWRVSVDVPWDELGVVAWLSWLSCDCLRLSVVVVGGGWGLILVIVWGYESGL